MGVGQRPDDPHLTGNAGLVEAREAAAGHPRRRAVPEGGRAAETEAGPARALERGLPAGLLVDLELILDLTETTYLSSSGVRLLYDVAERLDVRDQRLVLVATNEGMIRRVVALTT